MTCVTNSEYLCLPWLSFSRSPKGAYAEVGEDERECRRQCGLPRSGRPGLISVVLTNRRRSANEGEKQEEQPGNFQPQHVQHATDAAESDRACPVEGTHQAVLAALPSRDAEERPALSAEIAG